MNDRIPKDTHKLHCWKCGAGFIEMRDLIKHRDSCGRRVGKGLDVPGTTDRDQWERDAIEQQEQLRRQMGVED